METSSDQMVVFQAAPWSLYESTLEARGEHRVPRLSFLEGRLELMSPSRDHDWISSMLHALLMLWAEETGTPLNGTGSWTVRNARKKVGVEADQSYILGSHRPTVPDLAVEVIWTHGGLEKLEAYAVLRVPEVWFWIEGRIRVFVLGNQRYRERKRSVLLPKLDPGLLARFLQEKSQLDGLRGFRAALRST